MEKKLWQCTLDLTLVLSFQFFFFCTLLNSQSQHEMHVKYHLTKEEGKIVTKTVTFLLTCVACVFNIMTDLVSFLY